MGERMYHKIFAIALASALLSCGVVAHTCLGLAHNGFTVYMNPQNSSARVGHTFSINITISNVSSPGLWAYEFKLYYNKSLLEPLSARIPADHFLKPALSPDGIFIINPGTINQTEGTVSFAATLTGPELGKTGTGTLANITFMVMTTGKSALRIGGNMTGEPKFVDGNGDAIPADNYSLIDGYAEGLPLPPPPIPPPPQTSGKQTLTFNFMGIYGYLTFPDECHPKDVIDLGLIVAAEPEGIHLNYFRLNISCNTSLGQKTLHNETIENKDLPETWTLNQTIKLTIPSDSYGKVYCSIETETYRQFTTCDSAIGLYTTYIRTVTYEELQAYYQELLNRHNATVKELEHWITEYQKLNGTYTELSSLYNTTFNELQLWQTEYQKLNNTYHDLMNQYNTTIEQLNNWISKYQTLNSTYNQLQQNYSSLNSSYQNLQTVYTALKSSYDSLEANYSSLNLTYNLLKNNYDSLQERYNVLLEKFTSLNSTHQELSVNYTLLIKNFDGLKYNLTLLQAKYDNLTSIYSTLNSTYSALLEEFKNLESRNDALTRELWLTRLLWFTFLAVAVAATVYIVYLLKKTK
jgi:hypothetical protein